MARLYPDPRWLVVAGCAARTPRYERVDVDLGACAEDVALGDFDRDGRIDVVAALDAAGAIAVLPGGGDGTLGAPRRIPVPGRPRWVEPSDVDRDGILDLVVVREQAHALSVLRGDGRGGFTPFSETALDACPRGSADLGGPETATLADLDRDGDVDLVVGNAERSTCGGVEVLLGNGDGTFASPTLLETGGTPSAAVAGRFDADALPDLAVVNRVGGTLVVYPGRSDGTFTAGFTHGTGAFPSHLVAADLDLDGHLDLVVVNRVSDDLSVFRGRGDGTFEARGFLRTGRIADQAVVGDLDGDSLPDIAVADGGSDELSIHLGTGGGAFAPAVLHEAGHCVNALDLADFDGDGHLDVIAANCGGLGLSEFRWDGDMPVPEGLPDHRAAGEWGRPDSQPPPPPPPRPR